MAFDVDAQLKKLTAWQYLNAANFLLSGTILIILLLK